MGWRVICLGLAACTSEPPLRLGTTHTVAQSGALALLESLPKPARLSVVVAASGQILRAAADGNLDVILTHAPALEAQWMDSVHALRRCPFVASRFAIVGPPGDPARVAGATSAADAFRRMARTGVVFVTRGDSSGTHLTELALWRAAGVDPGGYDWYIETGADQAANLRQADEWKAYALADLPTFTRQPMLDLRVLYAGDTALVNPYTLYVIRVEPRHVAAEAFASWATASWRPRLLALRLPDGTPAFTASAGACAALPPGGAAP